MSGVLDLVTGGAWTRGALIGLGVLALGLGAAVGVQTLRLRAAASALETATLRAEAAEDSVKTLTEQAARDAAALAEYRDRADARATENAAILGDITHAPQSDDGPLSPLLLRLGDRLRGDGAACDLKAGHAEPGPLPVPGRTETRRVGE